MEILIFKTNIKLRRDLQVIRQFLDDCPRIQQWSIDLQDVDKVLRVCTEAGKAEIIRTVSQAGYYCEELPD